MPLQPKEWFKDNLDKALTFYAWVRVSAETWVTVELTKEQFVNTLCSAFKHDTYVEGFIANHELFVGFPPGTPSPK